MSTQEEKEKYGHFLALKKANMDYHKAVDRIFRESADWIGEVDKRASVKAEMGRMADEIFDAMNRLNDFIGGYYPPPD